MTEQPAGPHCGNNPNAQLTPADRQAVDDFKARLALRERIADTLAATDGWRWVSDSDKARSSTYRGYQTRADAVLAVLPAPADRAAELEEAATALDAQSCTCGCRRGAEFLRQRAAVIRASDGPSRMADEAQQPETQLPYIHVDDDGDQLDIGAVMASTYDGEAPVVYVAADQHQGDQVATVYVRPERVDEVIAALRSARQQAETLPAVGAQQPETPLRAELKPWQLLGNAPDEPLPQTERLVGGRRLTRDGAQQPETQAPTAGEPIVQTTKYTVNLLPETDINAHVFELTVEYRGHGQWAVLRHGWCLDQDGSWDYELRPSEREDEWIAAHRFDLDTALNLAKEAAPGVIVNGLTAADALARLNTEEPTQ
jgi:hypothetical protein